MDDNQQIKISVICPTYNAEKFIRQTIDSIFRQTYLPVELLISDDGSTDNTLEIIDGYLARQTGAPVVTRVIVNQHSGPGAARNRGLAAANNEWIAFLDADDYWLPEKLERVCGYIKKHPEKNFFCHDELYCKLNGERVIWQYGLKYRPDQPLPPQIYRRSFFSTSTVLCRRELIDKYGGFDETLPSAQDYELWLKMSPALRPYFIREVLGHYYEMPQSVSTMGYYRKYWHRLRIAWRHKEKVPWRQFLTKVFILTFSRSWFTSFFNWLIGRSSHN